MGLGRNTLDGTDYSTPGAIVNREGTSVSRQCNAYLTRHTRPRGVRGLSDSSLLGTCHCCGFSSLWSRPRPTRKKEASPPGSPFDSRRFGRLVSGVRIFSL